MARGYEAPIYPESNANRGLSERTPGYLRNSQSLAAGLDSARLKRHRGKACLEPAPLQEPMYFEVPFFDTDVWSESSASDVAAGLASARIHPQMPLYKSSYNPRVQPMRGTPCIMDIKTKKKVRGPQAVEDPLAHSGELVEASGKTWRRVAYEHTGAQQNWKLKNTNKRLDLSQSMSLKSSNGIAGSQNEWGFSKPEYYHTIRDEQKYFVAGAEDSSPASFRKYFKADLPPSKGHVKYNDSMSMPYFERQRKSFTMKAANPQLDTSTEFPSCMRPFGVETRFSPRNSFALPTSVAPRGAASEGQASSTLVQSGKFAETKAQRSTSALSRDSSMRSVQSDRPRQEYGPGNGLSRSPSARESPVASLQGSRRVLNPGNATPPNVESGGYPAQKSTLLHHRPRYERALPGTTSVTSARESCRLDMSSPTSLPSTVPSKIVPRSPLTWQESQSSPQLTQRSLQQSGRLESARRMQAPRRD